MSGLHFLIPIFVLIYLLVYLRLTASYSIFFATIALISVNLINKIIKYKNFKDSFKIWFNQTIVGFENFDSGFETAAGFDNSSTAFDFAYFIICI